MIMEDPRLSARKKLILRAVVDAHIRDGEPVGSKLLSQDEQISASPATIRNEMAELEQMGYLIQPHTSAGRVPSELGYRFYVDALVRQYAETKSEIDEINERLRFKLTEMDELLEEASRLASAFTDYTGIAFKSGAGKVRVEKFDSIRRSPKEFLLVMGFSGDIMKAKAIHLPFSVSEEDLRRFTEALNLYLCNLTGDEISMPVIVKLETLMGTAGAMVHPTIKVIYETMSELDTADIRVEGVGKLLQYPEYSDVSKLRSLLGALEEKDKLLDVISSHTVTEDGINVYIGSDKEGDVMNGSTLIFKNVTVGGKKLAVGVIGPKRMNYSQVIGMISKLATGIDRMFAEEPQALGDGGGTDEEKKE